MDGNLMRTKEIDDNAKRQGMAMGPFQGNQDQKHLIHNKGGNN